MMADNEKRTETPVSLPASDPHLRTGDKIPFGRYPQGESGEVEPLIWRVLAVENSRALLITDKLIDCVKYHMINTNKTWETCTLREWLNDDFTGMAFNSAEQARIAAVTNQNPNNPEYGTYGGLPTLDRVFVLSIEEAQRYFRSHYDRKATPTEYAIKRGAAYTGCIRSLRNGNKTGEWWLRSPGDISHLAAYVHADGGIQLNGYSVERCHVYVRPALWLHLA